MGGWVLGEVESPTIVVRHWCGSTKSPFLGGEGVVGGLWWETGNGERGTGTGKREGGMDVCVVYSIFRIRDLVKIVARH